MAATVVPIPGVKTTVFRGVAYLIWPEDADVTAAPTIEKLFRSGGNEKAKLWARFDYWVDGGIKDSYFHGWNEAGYEHCFVFKWNKGGQMQRLYGVLSHPKRRANRRFVVCVLFSHCVKFGKLTDPAQKRKAVELYRHADVIAAVGRAYPDK